MPWLAPSLLQWRNPGTAEKGMVRRTKGIDLEQVFFALLFIRRTKHHLTMCLYRIRKLEYSPGVCKILDTSLCPSSFLSRALSSGVFPSSSLRSGFAPYRRRTYNQRHNRLLTIRYYYYYYSFIYRWIVKDSYNR